MATLNANPIVYHAKDTSTSSLLKRRHHVTLEEAEVDEGAVEPWTAEEVFDLIRHINDPEHPLTLEQLRVAQLEHVDVVDTAAEGTEPHAASTVNIRFTPTIPHCSMATLIGLCLRVKLLRSLPRRFKVHISIAAGTHASEVEINKQLNDKERVAAALENHTLLDVVNKCIVEPEETEIQMGGKTAPSQHHRPPPPFAA